MPSLRTFRVDFDRMGATYMAGETITGTIVVENTKEKSVKGLYLSAKGEARVRWVEKKTEHNRTRRDTYYNSQKYFKYRFNILNSNNDSRVQIPVGYHKYSFQFQLPQNIPTSFEHMYGHIRYTVKVVIDRPWRFDHECKAAFTVVSMLDLNAHRHKCLGIDDEIKKNFYNCCCISAGTANIRIRVPSTGYVPGQSIVTTLDYSNSSKIRIIRFSTHLLREIKFHAITGKTKIECSEIATANYRECTTNQGQDILEFRVPPIPPSSLEHCNIIDLNYKLRFVIHVSGPHFNLVRTYPLLIGSVPLLCSLTVAHINPATVPMPTQIGQPYTTNNEQSSTDLLPAPRQPLGFIIPGQAASSSNDWQIPPPSYEECITGAEHIKDHDESDFVHGANTPFAPRYPVFDYPTPRIES
ncbi:arrestin domain-containing protein 17-like [Colletes gigas]|uniref:arrestin domain-containing protein 17-like n=1 Tax=Colletes gigas TaxID=935657 RepID=UPI001C9A3C7C|nr:arrestin domain-containing protein 17-like [Colletes gigas]